MAGPCQLAALLALPITAGVMVACGRAAGRAVAVAALGAGLVLLATPFTVEDQPGTLNQLHEQYCPVRYGMCFLSLAVLTLVAALDRLCRAVPGRLLGSVVRVGVAGGFTVAVGVQVRMLTRRGTAGDLTDCALVAGVVLLVAASVAWSVRLRSKLGRPIAVAAVAAGVAGAAAGAGALAGRWHDGFIPFYERMLGPGLLKYMDRQMPRGSAVCVLDLQLYPFFGSSRQFRVCQPGRATGYAAWAEYIESRRVVLVIARFEHPDDWLGWAPVRGWMAAHPAAFVRLGESSWPYPVYRVK
jgi:hypothetical protein